MVQTSKIFAHVYSIKQIHTSLVIVAVNVDDFNLIGMIGIIAHIVFHLKGKLELKNLRETTICLGL